MGSRSGWSLSVSVRQTLQWGDTEAKAISNNKHCQDSVSPGASLDSLQTGQLSCVTLMPLQLNKAGETAPSVKRLLGKRET